MSAVRPRSLVVAATFGLLLLAALRVDAGLAAPNVGPDPAPATKGTPAPDPYPAQTPSQPASEPVTQTPVVVTQTPASSSTGSATTTPDQTGTSVTRTRAQETPTRASAPPPKKTKKTVRNDPVSVPWAAPRPRRTQPVALASAADGRPLLFGGLGLAALALASGSLLFLVNRAGRLETR